MSLINVSVKHGQTLDDARSRLQDAVDEVRGKFPAMVQRVDWSDDRNAVTILGKGFDVAMRIDPQDLHVAGNITILGALLGGPFVAGLKQIVQKTFHKRLPG